MECFEPFTEKTLRKYISGQKLFQSLLGVGKLKVSEIGDGNINYVFLIQGDKQSIIVKQAPPYLRCVGESWKLSSERIIFEAKALEVFHTLAPEHVPKIYHKDSAYSLIVMQYLQDHCVLRKGLMIGEKYENFIESITDFMSKTLFKTSSYYLSSNEKRHLQHLFSLNNDLCTLTENVIFTFPYCIHESNKVSKNMRSAVNKLRDNNLFKQKMLELKYTFMNQPDALLHGDLHTGSIMINQKDLFIIDYEFTAFGPFGFDLGILLANLIMTYVSHCVCGNNSSYTTWLALMIEKFWGCFEKKFIALWKSHKRGALIAYKDFSEQDIKIYRQSVMSKIFSQMIGYAGCEMARRIIGLAGVPEIRNIFNPLLKLKAEKSALNIAISLVEGYDNFSSIQKIIEVIMSNIFNYSN